MPLDLIAKYLAIKPGTCLQIFDKQGHVSNASMWLEAIHGLSLLDAEAVRNFDATLFKHDRCAAVLLCGQFDRTSNLAFIKILTCDDEPDVDPRKHLWC